MMLGNVVDAEHTVVLLCLTTRGRGLTIEQRVQLATRPAFIHACHAAVVGIWGADFSDSPWSLVPAQSKEELLQFSIMPDGHRNYALTWFTMGAAMMGLALHAMRAGPRAPRGPKLGRMQRSSS